MLHPLQRLHPAMLHPRPIRTGFRGLGLTFASLLLLACTPDSGATPSEKSDDDAESEDSQTQSEQTPEDDADESPDEQSDKSTPDGDEDDPSESEDPGEDEDPTPDQKWDIGTIPDWEPENERGCEKIDFLFVVDNSGSMEDEQKNLIASFPGFMRSIRETLMTRDFQIMAVDSDRINGNGGSSSCTNGNCTCQPAPGCCFRLCETGAATICNGTSCADLEQNDCDAALGAGRVESGAGADCGIADDRRFITQDQDDVDGTFACMGTVGIEGSADEMVIQSMRNAISPEMNDAGGCNAGFVRDDAILVVTFITDEEENGTKSQGSPQEWYQSLVDAKGGNADAVVTIGLFGDLDTANPICDEFDAMGITGAEASPRLREFVSLFGDHGMAGSVCADDYEPYFTEAVSIIEGACDQFIPK